MKRNSQKCKEQFTLKDGFISKFVGTTFAVNKAMNEQEKQELKDILIDIAKSAGYKIINHAASGDTETNAAVDHLNKILYLGRETDAKLTAHEMGHIIDRGKQNLEEYMNQYDLNKGFNELSAWVNGWDMIKGEIDKQEFLVYAHWCLRTYMVEEEYHQMLDEMIK